MRRGIAAPVALVTVGLFSFAACGGGNQNVASKSTTTTTTTTVTSGSGYNQSGSAGSSGTGGSASSGTNGSGSVGSNGRGGSTGSGGGGGSQNTPNAIAKPAFTSAGASPGAIYCPTKSTNSLVTVSWATKNATSVVDDAGRSQPLSGSFSFVGCSRNSVTLTAKGIGGSTSASPSWNYLSAPPK